MTAPQQGFVIGVDLGTSNTVAVVRWPDGRTRPLLVDGAPIMPSGVFVDEHGRLHVGRDAARLAGLDPSRFEPNPKRRIDEPTVLLGDREILTVDLLAAILAAVARAAVEAVGFLPTAVLTHPAAWGSQRRDTLANAARRAGWPPVMLVPEPVAAARYFADVLRRPVPVGSALAVFDFGGGTLDIAVVRNDNGRFTVIGSGGVEDLGGLDIDAALVEHLGQVIAGFAPATWDALRNPATTTQRRDRRLFWDDVRGAKEMLSRTTIAPITVPGADQAIHLTREELDRVVGPLIHRAVWETGSVIASAGLRGDQLAGLFLVGGSSRLPLAARQLHAQLGIAPTVLEQPELPVAEGALAELAPPAPAGFAGAEVTSATGYGAAPTGFVGAPTGFVGSPAGSPAAPVSPGFGAPTSGGFGPVSGVPMSASQVIPPGQHGATAPIPVVSPTPPATRSRRGLLIGGIAAVVVLALVAAGGWFFFLRDRDTAVDFATLKAGKAFDMDDPAKIDAIVSATLNARAVIGWRVDKQFFVQAVDLDGMKTAWSKVTLDGDYSKWTVQAFQGGIVVTATGSEAGKVFLLDWKSGRKVWEGVFDTYDVPYGLGPVLAIHRYKGKKLETVTWSGKASWSRADHAEGSAIYGQSRNSELRGPGSFMGVPTARDMKARDDLISIDGDDKIRLINASDGADVRSWNNVGGYDAKYLAHEDKLFVAGGGTKYTVKAFDLTSDGQPSQIYTFPNEKVQIVDMSPCADGRLCLIDGSSGGKDNTVRAISVADKKEVWNAPAPGSTTLVPAGRQVLATDWSAPASVLLSYEGKQLLRREDKGSYGVRVTGGSLMFFTGTLSASSPTDITLVGVTSSSGERIALGPLSKTIGQSCSWNASVILCATGGKFQVWRFAAS